MADIREIKEANSVEKANALLAEGWTFHSTYVIGMAARYLFIWDADRHPPGSPDKVHVFQTEPPRTNS